MTVISLQSGSSGNCTYIESSDTSVLVDAGIAGAEVAKRLEAHGHDLRAVKALVVTHDHADHVSSAGVLGRRFGIPVYLTVGSYHAARRSYRLDRARELHTFRAGDTLTIHGLSIRTVPTPHDGTDGVAVVVSDRRRSVGVLTDLGHVFPGLAELIHGLDAVVLESNYELDLLESGRYPRWLKARIRGPAGHLSNDEAAALLAASPRLRWACLAHLSEENNRPEIALARSRERVSASLPLYVASRTSSVVLPSL